MNYFLAQIVWAVRAADEFLEQIAGAVWTADDFFRTESSSRSQFAQLMNFSNG